MQQRNFYCLLVNVFEISDCFYLVPWILHWCPRPSYSSTYSHTETCILCDTTMACRVGPCVYFLNLKLGNYTCDFNIVTLYLDILYLKPETYSLTL